MKKLLLVIALLLCASPVWAAPSFVQCTARTFVNGPSVTSSISFSSPPSVGNRIIITGSGYAAGTLLAPSLSDNQANSYAVDVFNASAGLGANHYGDFIASGKVVHSSGTFTVTATFASGAIDWVLCEVATGNATTFAPDKSGVSDALSGTSNSITAGGANTGAIALVISCQIQGNPSPSGYTNIWSDTTNLTTSCDYKSVIVSETSSVTYASAGYSAGAGVIATYTNIDPCGGSSPSWTAAGVDSGHVQTCIDSAVNGDTINIPTGSATWAANSVSVTKALTLTGATCTLGGDGIPTSCGTVIDVSGVFGSPSLRVTKSSVGNIRFNNIKFVSISGHDGDPMHSILVGGAWADHSVIFNKDMFAMTGSAMILCESPGGLIVANSAVTGTYISFLLTAKAIFGDGPTSWTTADSMGMNDSTGERNIYLEHNTVTGGQTGFYDCDDNCRIVDRHNTYVNSGGSNSHGFDTSPYGMRHFEVYSNIYSNPPDANGACGTWIYPFITDAWGNPNISFTTNVDFYTWIRGGTGVIYNNTYSALSTVCWGPKLEITATIRAIQDVYQNVFPLAGSPCNASFVTYPASKQVGQNYNGSAAFTDPVYVWGNSGTMGIWGKSNFNVWGNPCGLTYSDFWQSGRDYILSGGDGFGATAKPGYTAFTYPHPLLNGGSPPPTGTPSNRGRMKR